MLVRASIIIIDHFIDYTYLTNCPVRIPLWQRAMDRQSFHNSQQEGDKNYFTVQFYEWACLAIKTCYHVK